MPIQIGEKLPQATLMTMSSDGPKPVQADEYFSGRTVVLFAVPGAFTPTCSAQHLPGYIAQRDEILAKDVDAIACLSVNDVFVMDAWARQSGVDDKIDMLADGNAEFTQALGLEMDVSRVGLGVRSQRYAMVVRDGVVAGLYVEEPGAFKVSSAQSVLETL